MNLLAIRDFISSMLRTAAVSPIRCYQLTRYFRGPSCRFYPSCSEYVAESINRFGVFKGALLGLCRIGRCHPWNDGGVDMVPNQMNIRKFDWWHADHECAPHCTQR